jgi:meso-butanediol dehydrogenase / (S,S)-butanediol dehydrogenase / diacetyl reductase
MRLEGKVAAITGAATGIGRACALAYAAEGAAVVVGDVNVEDGRATVAAIEQAGGRAAFVQADVASSEACAAVVREAVERFGGLDVMHANAGIELCKSVLDTSDEEWQRVIDVNQSGVFYCCREAMRHMRENGGGSIVITASPHAFATAREIAAYASSKGGIVALMRAVALEGAPMGIRANAILPGAIQTPMIDREVAFASDPEEQLRRFAEAHPLGRMGQPEDMAPVAVFLASDDAGFVTGASIAAEGGLMAALNSGSGVSYTD